MNLQEAIKNNYNEFTEQFNGIFRPLPTNSNENRFFSLNNILKIKNCEILLENHSYKIRNHRLFTGFGEKVPATRVWKLKKENPTVEITTKKRF